MSIKKKYFKNKPVCKVTLSIPGEIANAAKKAAVVGEFNNWDQLANPMKRSKEGAFQASIELDKDASYQFRYLLDEDHWENDPEADGEVPNFIGASNSLIHV